MKQDLFSQEQQYFFRTYKRLPIEVVRGEGCRLYDRDGREYIDFFGGLAVNLLGYAHPRVTQAAVDQLGKYAHLSNYFVQEPQVQLAARLLQATGFKRIFFSNSGTEAVEGALKLARKWGKPQGKTELFSLTHSFHGRTMGALSLTERPKYREGYEPFLGHVGHIAFNDVADLTSHVDAHTLAVFVEFIQGEGGINVVSREFSDQLLELRRRHGFLIVADEIQAGIGRTGKFFGFEHFNVTPDIVVIAKAIGGGLPLGAILGNGRVADVFSYGNHGTTFGGNPVACAAGNAVLEEMIDRGGMKKAAEIGAFLREGFLSLQKEFPQTIREVRGFGCMIGVELARDGQPIVDELLSRGYLVNCTNATVLRLLPPITVGKKECELLLGELKQILSQGESEGKKQ